MKRNPSVFENYSVLEKKKLLDKLQKEVTLHDLPSDQESEYFFTSISQKMMANTDGEKAT